MTKAEIIEDVSLAPYTTLGVGGVARYFLTANTVVELVKGVQWALKKKIPYFILGGGSNVVISDQGFSGLVIRNNSHEITVDENHSVLMADSGVKSGKVGSVAASAGLSGVEFLFGIPGTIGGAVYGNAGLRGHETKDVVKDVVCLEIKGDQAVVVTHKASWLKYGYRTSSLKQSKGVNKPVILTVRLQLYPARREVILARTKEFLGHRRGGWMTEAPGEKHGTQPVGLKTAGCAFRNPSTEPEKAAGRLLEDVGAKKMTVGGAAVAREHANFVYNKDQAKAEDVIALMQKLRLAVYDRYGIVLEPEVEMIGEFTNEFVSPEASSDSV